MEKITCQTQNTLTVYKKDGTVIGAIPLMISGTSHRTRCSLISDLLTKTWHHYSVHGTNEGMKKRDLWMLPLIGRLFIERAWYRIDLATGKITGRT
jgi:hypothetical protein